MYLGEAVDKRLEDESRPGRWLGRRHAGGDPARPRGIPAVRRGCRERSAKRTRSPTSRASAPA